MDRQFTAMMEAIGFHMGCLRWVSSWSVGKNNGGLYIRFFDTRAKFSIVTVYENDFYFLPKEIVSQAQAEGAKLRPKRQATTEREDAEADGKLHTCDVMLIARYQFNPGRENEKWHFQGIIRTIPNSKKAIEGGEKLDSTPAEPDLEFKNIAEALDWAMSVGAYQDRAQARVALDGLRERDPGAGSHAWRLLVMNVVQGKDKRREAVS